MASVFHCALEDPWSFCPVTLPSHDCAPPSAHAPWSAVRSVRPLSSNVEFPFPVPCFFPVFLDFSPQSVGLAGGGSPPGLPTLSTPACLELGQWAPDLHALFFLFPWRLLRVPPPPPPLIRCGSSAALGPVRARQPLPRGGPERGPPACPQRAPAVLENSLPFEPPPSYPRFK